MRTSLIARAWVALLAGCNKTPRTTRRSRTMTSPPVPTPGTWPTSPPSRACIKTQDGLEYQVIKAGTGKAPQSGADMVTVSYKGSLINGKVFDEQSRQSRDASPPAR